MILTDIEAKLREIDPNVYYGMVDESRKTTVWDYIVFNRSTISRSGNKTAATDRFDVHIIRENYVPDGMDTEVIKALSTIPGVRIAGSDCTFTYVQKPNTNIIVEMLTIPFVRARTADA